MRKLVNLAFTPRMLQDLKPRIAEIVANLLERTASQLQDTERHPDGLDFIDSFTLPLPAMVICEMLGIPDDKKDRYCRCVQGLLPFSSGGGPAINEVIDQAQACLAELIDLFDDVIEARRQEPAEDLISAMVAAQVDGDRLSRDELFAICIFIFLAGHETTSSLLSNDMLALLENPDEYDKLKADPEGIIDLATEEFVRYESPVTRGARRALQGYELRGKQIGAGQTITHLIGARNRDPAVFENPDQLDVARQPNNHLGFGNGIHFCLGGHLARIQGSIAFRKII